MKKIFSVLLFLVVICQIRAEDTNITTMRKMTYQARSVQVIDLRKNRSRLNTEAVFLCFLVNISCVLKLYFVSLSIDNQRYEH